MTHAAPSAFTPAKVRAIAAAMRGWLLALAAWVIDTFGEKSRIGRFVERAVWDDVAGARRNVLCLIVLLTRLRGTAETLMPGTVDSARLPAHMRAPRTAPGGFRTARRRGSDFRQLTRGLMPRGRTLRGRIAILQKTIDDLDAAVTRLIARLRRGDHGAPYTLAAVCAPMLRERAITPTSADTS